MEEQITISLDNQAAIAALRDSVTGSLTTCSKLYTETDKIIRDKQSIHNMDIRGYRDITQNETADRLARKRVRTKPTGLEPFLPPL